MTISRYTPQAVLLATIDEARYRVLLTEDGKALVEGRLAVRNNQRSFLGLTLPPGATLWSAAVMVARSAREGPGDTLLLPLRKRRAAEESAAFAVDVVYVNRGSAWGAAGDRGVSLPSIDVPVSQTGVVVHHSPRFRLALQPGVFREQSWRAPTADVLRPPATGEHASGVGAGASAGTGSGTGGGAEMASAFRYDATGPAASGDDPQAVRELKGLVERFQRESRGARTAGVVPVSVQFPDQGPSLFLAAELTPEGMASQARFSFKRMVK